MKDILKLKKEFSRIYDKYIVKIYRFVFLKVNVKESAEDITSETFKKGWDTYRLSYGNIGNINALLYQIAKNLIIDYYRKNAKTATISIEDMPFLVDAKSMDFEDKIALNTELEKIKKALEEIDNPDYQNVLIWYYLNEVPVKEIAQILNRTEPATRTLISRSLQVLRQKIEKI